VRVLVLLFLLATAVRGELPTLKVEKVRDESAGGSFTRAAVGVVDGRKVFLKSIRGNPRGTRYANFESDILAYEIFTMVGIKCPRAWMVRLADGSPLKDDLGTNVLAMEFVDSKLVRGQVGHGGWPGKKKADVEQYLDMALVDILIGNGDRREPNFFTAKAYGDDDALVRPVPVDNNCGFATMTVWSVPTSQVNFLPSYSGAGTLEVMKDLGTIRGVFYDAQVHAYLFHLEPVRKRALARAGEIAAELTDAKIRAMVEALPREVIPPGVSLEVDAEWVPKLEPAARSLLFGESPKALRGNELFLHRKAELISTLAWRRDHLAEALAAYFKYRDTDPEEIKRDKNIASWMER
jgi:hypothetical protein